MWDTPAFLPLRGLSCDTSLVPGGSAMRPGLLVDRYTSTHVADLERERAHLQLLAQVPKTRYFSRLVSWLGTQIITLGIQMQHVEAKSA